jgi:hypothetical protein
MSSPLSADGLHLRGDLSITVRAYPGGPALMHYEIRNMIMYNGLTAVLQLLAQKSGDPAPSTLKVSGLRVGTGTTPPARGDTNLVAPVYTITVNDGDKTETTSGTFELRVLSTLPNGTNGDPYNNVTLSEAGLILGTNLLFARQIYPGIPKNTANVVEYDWRVSLLA